MGVFDTILNVACVLLWVNWRSLQLARKRRASPLSIVSTVKTAEPKHSARWVALGTLLGLLGLRTVFYWNLGSAVDWTPSLRLGVINLSFRSDYLVRIVLFSVLSFGLVLGVWYASLLLISVINRKVPNEEPFQRFVRLHLGWVERWPCPLKLLLPMVAASLLWGLGSPGLVRLGIIPPPVSKGHLWEQAVVLGLTSLLIWKLLLVGICVLYLVNNYVYLGESSFWRYVNTTGANLLAPLRPLPLCIGKLNLAPFLGIVMILAGAYWLARGLSGLFLRLPL